MQGWNYAGMVVNFTNSRRAPFLRLVIFSLPESESMGHGNIGATLTPVRKESRHLSNHPQDIALYLNVRPKITAVTIVR